MKVYIFGTGKGLEYVQRCLRDDVEIIAYIDNYKSREETINGVHLVNQHEIINEYDFIIVSLMAYDGIVKSLLNEGVETRKIVSFFNLVDSENKNFWNILDPFKWRFEIMWKSYKEKVLPISWNINYELYEKTLRLNREIPTILSAGEAITKIVNEHCSLSRFGDGEFEQIRGLERANFQNVDNELGVRLKEVLNCKRDNLIIAIADNYGSLEKDTDEAARAIREYLTPETRKAHMELLDMDRVYYDAYLSRTYLMYRDKANAGKRFNSVKKIWEGQDVLIVEGRHTRFGVGNDLLDNAKSIKRILCPDKNSFSKYKEIYNEVLKHNKECLIMTILGPTATILAHDLSSVGYWAIDIGQLDTEYEWYLRKTQIKCEVYNKTVSEYSRYTAVVTDEEDPFMKKYFSEVIAEVDC